MSTGSQIGRRAPEIDLPDGRGGRWRLSDFAGRVVVLLFYPGDETPVCTRQLCSLRDNWQRYQETGAVVAGINTDSVEKHRRFAENHDLPLSLLSDPDGKVVRDYGMKSLLGTKRGVVVIDGEGIIRHWKTVLPVFRPTDDEILEAIREIGASG